MHHFSSFNNQWYRKSIEYMQDVVGHPSFEVVRRLPRPRRFSSTGDSTPPCGNRSTPPRHRPGWPAPPATPSSGSPAAWETGRWSSSILPCMTWPPATNAFLQWAHDFLTMADPGPHKKVFMKPFHRKDTAEFCLELPQGPSGFSGEPLPLAARIQRLRQLAGQRRFGPGSPVLLLPAPTPQVRRLPHAPGGLQRPGETSTARSTLTDSRQPIRPCLW